MFFFRWANSGLPLEASLPGQGQFGPILAESPFLGAASNANWGAESLRFFFSHWSYNPMGIWAAAIGLRPSKFDGKKGQKKKERKPSFEGVFPLFFFLAGLAGMARNFFFLQTRPL